MTLLKHPRWGPLLPLGLTIVAVLLLAAGFERFELHPGQPFPYTLLFGDSEARAAGGVPLTLPGGWLEIITTLSILLLALILVLWIITFIIRPQARKRMLRRIITYFLLLLLLSSLLSVVRQLRPLPDPKAGGGPTEARIEPTPPPEAMPTPPAFVIDPPAWLSTLIILGFMLLLFGALWILWQRRRPSLAPSPAVHEDVLDRLMREAHNTLADLQQGDDVKNRVLGCYRAMTEMMKEERGIERAEAMTARDFERHLWELGFSDDHIRRLTRLFERFRYGAAAPSEQAEAEAIDCLSSIVKAYGGAA